MVVECKWTNPGSDPFKGDPIKAMRIMGIPKKNAEEILVKFMENKPSFHISFDKSHLHATNGVQYTMLSTTFGNTVCLRPHILFDKAERAPVYVSGKYFVAVPPVCGNFSRLSDYLPRGAIPVPNSLALMLGPLIWLMRRFMI